MNTPYMRQLLANWNQYQDAIECLLEQFNVQPVGNGYIDLILPRKHAPKLIGELSRLPVVVEGLAWWCHCTPDSMARLGCPHGMGGPVNEFGEGWFSEYCAYLDVTEQGIDLGDRFMDPRSLANECGRVVCDYIENRLPLENFYSECIHPALWLQVPNNSKREKYWVG
jgi:hypothetical protein